MILIRPEVAMYAAFARLNYKPWFALAEFVDNSLQSGLSNINLLKKADGKNYKLKVEISIDEDRIEIRDNAAGISIKDYARAFLPASPPPDTSGLSEFGLGMKAAASWFAKTWIVRTKALDEHVERSIIFDIPMIVKNNIDNLEAVESPASANAHYTVVRLQDLQIKPKGKTIVKIRDHLCSIYRIFIRDNLLELRLNEELLSFDPPNFLITSYHATPKAKPVKWYKKFSFDLGNGHKIKGWAALLAKGSVANAGFAVFRRRRLIQGSYGEAYRPPKIFGPSNKFIYQRLIGELEVSGFSVSHTKDGIQWEDWEDDILSWLKTELNSKPIPLLDQADNYRPRTTTIETTVRDATSDIAKIITQHLPPVIDKQIQDKPNDEPLAPNLTDAGIEESFKSKIIRLDLKHSRRNWNIIVELINDVTHDDWYEISKRETKSNEEFLQIRINFAHPFMIRFVSPDGGEIIPFVRLAVGLAMAEITARESGVRQAGTLRMNLNQILRTTLAGPVQKGEVTNV